jgi:hypothetical protein
MQWNSYCLAGHKVRINWFKHIVQEIDEGRYVIRDKEWTWNSNRDINPICECGKSIDKKEGGLWIPTSESNKRGYQLTKLFTGTVPYTDLMDRFIKGLTNDELMQRFYNADLGEAYTAKGSHIDADMITECVQDYIMGPEAGVVITGIDVGKFYHFVIKKMLPGGNLKTLYIGKCKETLELITILRQYNVKVGVIDADPETREAKKIASCFNAMFLCRFRKVDNDKIDIKRKTITVQRTPALDAVMEALLLKAIIYPKNILHDEEFLSHMTCSVRVFNKEKDCYDWIEGDADDHYFLSTAYCLIARRMVLLIKG